MFDELSTKPLLNILKAIKDISQEPTTLDYFQQAGAIPLIVSLMDRRRNSPEITTTPLYQYLLQIAFQFCRLVPDRQREAASHGMIVHLKAVIDENSTSKQVILVRFKTLILFSSLCPSFSKSPIVLKRFPTSGRTTWLSIT